MHRGGHWRKRWESKLADMSPDERKKWKKEMGRHMCWGDTSKPAEQGGPAEAKTEA